MCGLLWSLLLLSLSRAYQATAQNVAQRQLLENAVELFVDSSTAAGRNLEDALETVEQHVQSAFDSGRPVNSTEHNTIDQLIYTGIFNISGNSDLTRIARSIKRSSTRPRNAEAPIDRHAVVTRHNPTLDKVNTSEVAVLGNGAFALSIDVTGLQTLNETFSGVPNTSSPFRCKCAAHAEVFFPLMTGSDWGWHSFKPPGPPGSKADPFAPPQLGSFWDLWRVSSNRSAMRESWYPTGSAAAGPSRKGPSDPALRAAIEWRGVNPHRLSLGQIALRKLRGKGNGTTTEVIRPEELSNITQTLDLWSGVAHSTFELAGTSVAVDTAVHGQADLVSATVESPLVAAGLLGVAVSFGGGTGDKSGANWTISNLHFSEVVKARSSSNSVLIRRSLDYDEYLVRISFSDGYTLLRVGPHAFVVVRREAAAQGAAPEPLWVSVSFAPATEYGIQRFLPKDLVNSSSDAIGSWLSRRWALATTLSGMDEDADPDPPVLPSFSSVASASADHWREYWSQGGIIDFSAAFGVDPRAVELERRTILSMYLVGAQEAGFVFTGESGLILNSWVGKFHMEMKMWHTAHFALWGRPQLLGHTNLWYIAALENATWYAGVQGYRGARWGKETGPQFNREITTNLRTTCGGGLNLIWNQPHAIFLSELEYRAASSDAERHQVLERYADVVNASAVFMADFARGGRAGNASTGYHYELGPPIMSSSEHGDKLQLPIGCGAQGNPCLGWVYNPTYELTYFKYGLHVAMEWDKRRGLLPNDDFLEIYQGLDPAPTVPSPWNASQQLYTLHAACKNLYKGQTEGCAQRSDHPGHLMAFGSFPGHNHGIDIDIANATFTATARVWDLEHGYYGTDPHLMAISAARLGRSDDALHFVMLNSDENRFSIMGHQLNFGKVGGYLPGNGAMLHAVAAMAVGFEGSIDCPGFPPDWHIRHEGLVKLP